MGFTHWMKVYLLYTGCINNIRLPSANGCPRKSFYQLSTEKGRPVGAPLTYGLLRFWIVCGLAALSGGRCLADGRLLGRRFFLGRGGGGDRGLLGGLGLGLGLLFGGSRLDLGGLRRRLGLYCGLGLDLSLRLGSSSLGRGLLGRRRCALASGGLGGRLGLNGCFGLGLGGRPRLWRLALRLPWSWRPSWSPTSLPLPSWRSWSWTPSSFWQRSLPEPWRPV